jgi:hypothetical protein
MNFFIKSNKTYPIYEECLPDSSRRYYNSICFLTDYIINNTIPQLSQRSLVDREAYDDYKEKCKHLPKAIDCLDKGVFTKLLRHYLLLGEFELEVRRKNKYNVLQIKKI